MGQSLSKVYVHITFSTKNRKNLIDKNIEADLFSYIGGICKGLKCYPIQIGGHRNHVHILSTLAKDITQSKYLRTIKSDSSTWIKTKGSSYSKFYWQNGYAIFSVDERSIDVIKNYILNQERHHQNISFKDEFRKLMSENNIEFDEKYVWD